MKSLSKLVLCTVGEVGGHHTLELIAKHFGDELHNLSSEAKEVMLKRLSGVSPRSIKQQAAFVACGGTA